jgi:membrane dipeptidase
VSVAMRVPRRLLVVAFAVGLVSCGGPPPAAPRGGVTRPPSDENRAPPALAERAKALHAQAIVVDTHNDITSNILDQGFDLGKPTGKTHTDLPKMKAGGITAEFFAIYVESSYTKPTAAGGGSARRALDMIDIVYQQVERHPEDLTLATTVDDVRRAKKEGKIAILMGIEGGHAIENSLYALREFHRLGVRYMTLTHTNTNDWADSAGGFGPPPEARHHGLSPFGEEVVREMQRIGMLVDVSHVSDETFDDVLKVAKCPVIASHSSSRAIAPHVRNLTDEQLRALAKNGGVAMVNFFTGFTDPKVVTAQKKFQAEHGKEMMELFAKYKNDHEALRTEMTKLYAPYKPPPTPLSVLIDHIDHMAKVAGADHVGLGSDFDGVLEVPKELGGIDGLPKITLELMKRGYTDEQVKKILGENFLRVMGQAEDYARSTKTTLSGDGSTKKIQL